MTSAHRVRLILARATAAAIAALPTLAGATTPPADPAVPVRLVHSEPAGSAPWVAASLAPVHHATISTRLSASVQAVHVEEGAQVAQGQLLLSLSDQDLRAALAAAETALANATVNERRITELAAQRAATKSEVEMAQAQRAQAAAAVAAARANLGYTQLRAPFAGRVQARRVNAGDLVGPGQPLLEIEGAGLEVQASLSEAEARGLRLGQKLRFRAGDRSGEAVVTALTPGGDPLSHRRGLRARVATGGEGLRSGTFARVELPGAPVERDVAWVPRSAIVERGDLTGVFVAEEGRARLRWVSLGEPAGDRIPVRAGLKPGEAVIDTPGALRDDQAVEISRGD